MAPPDIARLGMPDHLLRPFYDLLQDLKARYNAVVPMHYPNYPAVQLHPAFLSNPAPERFLPPPPDYDQVGPQPHLPAADYYEAEDAARAEVPAPLSSVVRQTRWTVGTDYRESQPKVDPSKPVYAQLNFGTTAGPGSQGQPIMGYPSSATPALPSRSTDPKGAVMCTSLQLPPASLSNSAERYSPPSPIHDQVNSQPHLPATGFQEAEGGGQAVGPAQLPQVSTQPRWTVATDYHESQPKVDPSKPVYAQLDFGPTTGPSSLAQPMTGHPSSTTPALPSRSPDPKDKILYASLRLPPPAVRVAAATEPLDSKHHSLRNRSKSSNFKNQESIEHDMIASKDCELTATPDPREAHEDVKTHQVSGHLLDNFNLRQRLQAKPVWHHFTDGEREKQDGTPWIQYCSFLLTFFPSVFSVDISL